MNSLTMKGSAAELRWAYHRAAELSSWALSSDGTLTAQIKTHDAFKVSQRPLMFVVQVKSGSWKWDVTTLQISGTTLTASVIPERSPDVDSSQQAGEQASHVEPG